MSTFDTLNAATALETAGFTPDQAKAAAGQLQAAAEAGRGELVSRTDLKAEVADLKAEIANLNELDRRDRRFDRRGNQTDTLALLRRLDLFDVVVGFQVPGSGKLPGPHTTSD